jgi:uncharacterized membrane protein
MMTFPHLINLAIHIAAGTIAITVGLVILATAKGTANHKQKGKLFAFLTLTVALSAAVGLTFFRFMPVFAVLTILVPYQLIGGWRVGHTKENGPNYVDALLTLAAIALAALITPLVAPNLQGAGTIAYSALGGLYAVIAYDVAKWMFPTVWHKHLWLYEHSYKLVASLFGMVSALVGNVVRSGQPWSQLAPLIIGVAVVGYFWIQIWRRTKCRNHAPT